MKNQKREREKVKWLKLIGWMGNLIVCLIKKAWIKNHLRIKHKNKQFSQNHDHEDDDNVKYNKLWMNLNLIDFSLSETSDGYHSCDDVHVKI